LVFIWYLHFPQCNEGLLKRSMALLYSLLLVEHGRRSGGEDGVKVSYTSTSKVKKAEQVIIQRWLTRQPLSLMPHHDELVHPTG